jgi:cytochrome c biogenesis protein CcmG, thiol:disulfide interchange protein DsbE
VRGRSWGARRVALAILLVVLALGTASAQFAGDTLPAFELRDADGVLVRSSDYEGRMWVLNVWASWCPPCREELPLLARMERELADAGLDLVLLNAGESASTARGFLDQEGLTLRTLADPDAREADLERTNDVLRRLRNRGLPTTYFIDADLVIQSVYVGELTPVVLSERLATLGLDWQP